MAQAYNQAPNQARSNFQTGDRRYVTDMNPDKKTAQDLAANSPLNQFKTGFKPTPDAAKPIRGNDMKFANSEKVNAATGFSAGEDKYTDAENALAGAGRDSFEAARSAPETDAIARAGAMGFGNSGVLSGALDEINTNAATSKAGATRDAKIAFSKERGEDDRFNRQMDFAASESQKDRDERSAIRNEDKSMEDLLAAAEADKRTALSTYALNRGGGGAAPEVNQAKFQLGAGGGGDAVPLQGGGWGKKGNANENKGNSSKSSF